MDVGFDVKSLKASSLLPMVAGLLLLGALWQAWNGWQRWSSARLEARADQVRADVAAELKPKVDDVLAKANLLKSRVALVNAVKANDATAARDVVADTLRGSEAVEIHATGLDAGYGDPEKFGYGKLGLLESALNQGAPALAVVRDAGGPRVGVAIPVIEDGRTLAVVYARMPLAPWVDPIKDAAPSRGYLALRQGSFNII